MASCTFKDLVSSQCGGEVLRLELCKNNIDSHLKQYKMKGTKGKGPSGYSEIDLILARAFAQDLAITTSTICASHRSSLTTLWRTPNRLCTLFHKNGKKIFENLTIKESKYLHRQLNMQVTPGYGICMQCKKDGRLKEEQQQQ